MYAISTGGIVNNEGKGIETDSTGSVYVTGYFSDSADFDPGAGTAELVSAGSNDIFFAKYDGSGRYVYAKSMGSSSPDNGSSIAIDKSGNVVITGNFSGTVDFDPGAGTVNLTSYANSIDIFIAKYDRAGNYIYAHAAGGTSSDVSNSITVDAVGNAYITGSFVNSANFDPSPGATALISAGGNDIFIAKYDAEGNYLYAKAMGGSNTDEGKSIAVDDLGNVFITGFFYYTADFDPGAGVANVTSVFANDLFIARYDTFGNYVFVKAIGGIGADFGYGIAIDRSGNLYCAGSFAKTVDFDPGEGTVNLEIGGIGVNGFVCSFSNIGVYKWASQLGNYRREPYSGVGKSIAVDASGNTYVAGSFINTVDFDPGAGTAYLTSTGGNDIFLAKYDASGNYIYARAMGGNDEDIVNDIAIDSSGNILITGYFFGTADFDPGSATVNLISTGSNDIFIAKYNPSGNLIYAKAIGGVGDDAGNGIVADGSGNVYVTGYFSGSADFDPGTGTAMLASAGGLDIFIVRFDELGGFTYAKAIGGERNDVANGIAISSSGDLFITGYFTGTSDFDPGTGSATLKSATGNMEGFVARYDAFANYIYAKSLRTEDDRLFSYGNSIAADNSNNVYITGAYTGFLGTISYNVVFIAKYNASGNNIYTKKLQITSAGAQGTGIAADGFGNAYLTGIVAGSVNINFDPQKPFVSLSGTDAFLIKYDASGNYVFGKDLGGLGNDAGRDIALDAFGNVYLTGSFAESVNFDPGGNSTNATITATTENDIFFAKYGPLTALPVNILSFTANPVNNQSAVRINWRTASQTNNAYFEAAHSKDGQHFVVITRTPACNTCIDNQSYQVLDTAPYQGLSYYRLKQVDNNNSISYSAIAKVNIVSNVSNLVVQVVPSITKGVVQLMIKNSLTRKEVVVRFQDATGRLVQEQKVWLSEGNNTFNYNLSGASRGVYYVSVTGKQNATVTARLVKQ